MILLKLEKRENKNNPFYAAAYKTTFPLNWQKMLCLSQTFIDEFEGNLLSVVRGKILDENSCNGKDCIDEIKANNFSIRNCKSFETAQDIIRITGVSKTCGGFPLTVWLYNSSNKSESHACVVEIPFKEENDPIELFGKDFFTPILDMIEIIGMHRYYKEMGI